MKRAGVVVFSMIMGALLCLVVLHGIDRWSTRSITAQPERESAPVALVSSAGEKSEEATGSEKPIAQEVHGGAGVDTASSMGIEFSSFQSRENTEFLFSTGLVVQDLLSSEAMVFGPNE